MPERELSGILCTSRRFLRSGGSGGIGLSCPSLFGAESRRAQVLPQLPGLPGGTAFCFSASFLPFQEKDMASHIVQNPGAGCIVEFMQGNEAQIAWVMEEQKGKLRLFLPNRRETTLSPSRILPWSGPAYAASQSKDSIVDILNRHRERRERLASEVAPVELWEMAQGEMDKAPAEWFAELGYTNPDADAVAACGRALLQCKTHFRFQPPEFEIYDEATVESRRQAEEAARVREAMVCGGADWFRRLWDARIGRQPAPSLSTAPDEAVCRRLEHMLRAHMIDPETVEDEALWKQVTKGLSDDPHLALLLAMTWGLVPEHYNFWLDRADYRLSFPPFPRRKACPRRKMPPSSASTAPPPATSTTLSASLPPPTADGTWKWRWPARHGSGISTARSAGRCSTGPRASICRKATAT